MRRTMLIPKSFVTPVGAEPWQNRMFKTHPPGSTHRMLGVPKGDPLPLTFMQAIVDAEVGDIVKNPTKIGFKQVKVTRYMKAKMNGILNAIRVSQGKYRSGKFKGN